MTDTLDPALAKSFREQIAEILKENRYTKADTQVGVCEYCKQEVRKPNGSRSWWLYQEGETPRSRCSADGRNNFHHYVTHSVPESTDMSDQPKIDPFSMPEIPTVDYSVEGECPSCGKHDLMVMDQTVGCGSCDWNLWGIHDGKGCLECGGCCCDYTEELQSTHIDGDKHSCKHCADGQDPLLVPFAWMRHYPAAAPSDWDAYPMQDHHANVCRRNVTAPNNVEWYVNADGISAKGFAPTEKEAKRRAEVVLKALIADARKETGK